MRPSKDKFACGELVGVTKTTKDHDEHEEVF